jgi:hypothetical protein
VSQFCRRIKDERCRKILCQVYDRLVGATETSGLLFLDARPFPVGPCSQDAEARAGRIYGGFARGYKLHALVSENRSVPIWSVMPLNVSETTVAEELIRTYRPSGLLLADANYDSMRLYDQVAQYTGQLLTPVPKNGGKGHRKQSRSRSAVIASWKGIAGYVYQDRFQVEGCFGNQSSFGGGLGPLPAWVRTLPRVRRWVGAKLIIYHARLRIRKAVS